MIYAVAAIVVVVLLLLTRVITKKKVVVLDRAKYQARWQSIERELKKNDEATYTVAVLEADKLLDKAMVELGVAGSTMGERLKQADKKFSAINAVWSAHKLRNQIAHEDGFTMNYDQATKALAGFKQGLKDLGAL